MAGWRKLNACKDVCNDVKLNRPISHHTRKKLKTCCKFKGTKRWHIKRPNIVDLYLPSAYGSTIDVNLSEEGRNNGKSAITNKLCCNSAITVRNDVKLRPKPKSRFVNWNEVRIPFYCPVSVYFVTDLVKSRKLTMNCAFASCIQSARSAYNARQLFYVWSNLIRPLNWFFQRHFRFSVNSSGTTREISPAASSAKLVTWSLVP